ncbi:FAD-dependent monooxygenase [Rhodococcoides yunnanense]|uniref:FAD-dependent monooxygenase n=1 Tax=Rhodococcoides yunnanense TaxID=278209 RepID=UPI000932A250|nr:FAD-dependent monooxygenase [Rhodococcus yunnanensis]
MTSVLVIGAGLAGCAAAIAFAEGGASVSIVEKSPRDSLTGSGITLQGNALRVLRRLGVLQKVLDRGYPFDSLGIRAPDADATLLVEIADARTGGADLPAGMGMERPVLASILRSAAEEAGASIEFEVVPTELSPHPAGVTVGFSDGSTRNFDLVIGADGVRSWTRRTVGVDLDPRPTGLGIWRVLGSRPGGITRTEICYGGPGYLAGYCPTGDTSSYAYIVEDAQDRSAQTPQERLAVMTGLAGKYHGVWKEITAELTDPDAINYTWFETHVLDGPWHRGRIVLIGDAAHSCPPTVAQGGAQALEDAVVLADMVLGSERIDDALLDAYAARRLPRVRAVVEASVQISDWMRERDPAADIPGVMGRVAALVSETP